MNNLFRNNLFRFSLPVSAGLLLAALSAAPCAAGTGLDFTLDTPTISTGTSSADQVFTFYGTLTNSSSMPLYLNGDLFSVDAPLSGDDSALVNSLLFPTDSNGDLLPQPELGAGQSLNLALFNITVPTGTPSGQYSGLFQLQGGATTDDYDLLASQSFQVTTSASPAPPPSAVPEVPGGMTLTVGLLMTAGLVVAARRKKVCASG